MKEVTFEQALPIVDALCSHSDCLTYDVEGTDIVVHASDTSRPILHLSERIMAFCYSACISTYIESYRGYPAIRIFF